MNKGYTVKIEGMACPSCAQSVIDALSVFGDVTVDLELKEAYISTDAQLESEKIKDLIGSIGYEFIGMTKNG